MNHDEFFFAENTSCALRKYYEQNRNKDELLASVDVNLKQLLTRYSCPQKEAEYQRVCDMIVNCQGPPAKPKGPDQVEATLPVVEETLTLPPDDAVPRRSCPQKEAQTPVRVRPRRQWRRLCQQTRDIVVNCQALPANLKSPDQVEATLTVVEETLTLPLDAAVSRHSCAQREAQTPLRVRPRRQWRRLCQQNQ
jgi:hypothetical protein